MIFLERGDSMEFQATDYKPEDICRIMREWTDLERKDFGKSIHRTERSVRSLETGERTFSVQTLLDIAKAHDIKIIIKKDVKERK